MADLEEEARHATELLRGKCVREVWRHRAAEVGIGFTDGTRLFVDCTDGAAELSITDGIGDDGGHLENSVTTVWIFVGDHARHPAGVFASKADGFAWAMEHQVSGLLTAYPVGGGCYDIAVRDGQFQPSKPHHGSPDHVAAFSPGWTEHVHLVDGRLA